MIRKFAFGTGLCILAGMITILVSVLELPTVYVLSALPFLFVGFGVQIHTGKKIEIGVEMKNETSFHKPIGIALAVISGLAAIGITVWFSHSAVPLLALILLGWGIEVVSTSKKPLTIGLILSVTYLVIGVVGWYTNSPTVLWAMVLANWLGDSI